MATRAIEQRPMDATPSRDKLMTLTKDALRDFRTQTVVETRSHIHIAIEDMHWTMTVLARMSLSTTRELRNQV